MQTFSWAFLGKLHWNAERVIDNLEAAGIHSLPNHHYGETIKPEPHELLKRHGVEPDHTTAEAMAKVFEASGFPPHKTNRF